jgi:acyl dehydratase
MSSETHGLKISDVSQGDALPELSYDVSPSTIVLGALATRDWRPMHHDYKFATERNGVQDIFLNTPNQAAWFERYLTDWTGSTGRLGRIKFRMKASVFPGDTMVFNGSVKEVGEDDAGCGWADLVLELKVGDKVVTGCEARMAIPTDENDNPWSRAGDAWKP